MPLPGSAGAASCFPRVVRRRELVSAAWPPGAIVNDNTLDQYVARIRRKLAQLPAPAELVTVHGVGYRLG